MKRSKSRSDPKPGSPAELSDRQEAVEEHQAPPDLFPIVGIGASAGGLEAFSELLRNLPPATGMAFVLVQHLDPTHGSVLAEILSRTTKLPVIEVTDAIPVERDRVYVIPPNANMVLEDGTLRLAPRTLTRGQHMPVNYFFQSMAHELGNRAIGVILSGTASDGAEGCTAIKVAGGITLAQDQKSAKFSSMPRSAVQAGSIDFVLSPKLIAQELVRIGKHPYITRIQEETEPEGDMHALFRLLHRATNVDFTHYKQTTLQRRIKRRMVLHKLERFADYLAYIKEVPSELDELYRDLLIHVTSFFRDPQAFEALRALVFPKLLESRRPADSPLRIWVPGCSSGEEVYSIAIVLLEYLWEHAANVPLASATSKEVQFFATDLSEQALDRARSGLYAEHALLEVSPERLKRFFVRLDGGFQINKSLREMCIFARQNLANDPPFSNLDLISCRNLLIYLGPALQKRVIPTLHYALKPDGYLMLGESESLGSYVDQFALIDKKNKIYQKKKSSSMAAAGLFTRVIDMDYSFRNSGQAKLPKSETGFTVDKEVERILSSRFVPASIVVNEEMEIVQFRGRTGDYLEPPLGHPTFSLSKMAREGLLIDLRSAISKARKDGATVRKEGVRVRSNGGTREITLEVIPIRTPGSNERFYVVVFLEPPADARSGARAKGITQKQGRKQGFSGREKELHNELAQMREQLQSLIEERDTTAEEYKSANEEVLSANEELQSTNEELETAKEELQSSNEELTTLNEELHNRNTELSAANNDLVNLFANVNVPVVMVGNDLRIRRFTPPAQRLLNLLQGDIGRRIGEIRPNADLDDLEKVVHQTIDSGTTHEREVRESSGIWYAMRVRPYKTWENKIDGAVISFQDIDALKRTLEETQRYADALIENARESILVLQDDLRVMIANRAFYRSFRVSSQETEGRLIYELGNGQWNIPRLRHLLDKVIGTNSRIDDFEVHHEFPQLGTRNMMLNARRIATQKGRQLILLSIEDITELSSDDKVLRRQKALLELAHDAVIVRNSSGIIDTWNQGAEELYGWTKEEAVGKQIYELLQTEFPKPVQEIEAVLVTSGRWDGELVHTTKSGERKIVSSRWALLRESDTSGVVLEINNDITLRKQSEEELRQLSGYLMRVQDEERRRLARELHDSTGQKLVAMKMNLETVAKQGGIPSTAKKMLAESSTLLDEATQEIRTLAQLLHPPLLDEAGLSSAIQWLVDGFSSRSGIAVDLVLPPQLQRLPQYFELALFRVVQESLINIHRHSGAKKAKIELTQNKETLTLQVSDNGKGLPAGDGDGKKPTLGVGIRGMRERLAQLGGKLEVRSNNNKGASIKAVIPLQKANS
jgi:two-component system CheB/CheR fusion protein